jgi:hypothetical protein
MGKLSIARLLLFGQRMKLRFLDRNLAVRMKITQTDVSGIRQAADMFGKETAAFLEQFKIALASIGKGCGKNRLGFLVNNQLRFLSVTLLFTAVVLALFFSAVQSAVPWHQSTPLRSGCHSVAVLSCRAGEIRPISPVDSLKSSSLSVLTVSYRMCLSWHN